MIFQENKKKQQQNLLVQSKLGWATVKNIFNTIISLIALVWLLPWAALAAPIVPLANHGKTVPLKV